MARQRISRQHLEINSNERFPKLNNFALKMLSVFITTGTYVCESTFPVIKRVESKYRNRIADKTLNDCLQFATIDITIDVQTIV